MKRPTKSCELRVHLMTGHCLVGRYHIDASTSSTVRPSDAIRQDQNLLLLLSDAVDAEDPDGDERLSVMIPKSSISVIELSTRNWE